MTVIFLIGLLEHLRWINMMTHTALKDVKNFPPFNTFQKWTKPIEHEICFKILMQSTYQYYSLVQHFIFRKVACSSNKLWAKSVFYVKSYSSHCTFYILHNRNKITKIMHAKSTFITCRSIKSTGRWQIKGKPKEGILLGRF